MRCHAILSKFPTAQWAWELHEKLEDAHTMAEQKMGEAIEGIPLKANVLGTLRNR